MGFQRNALTRSPRVDNSCFIFSLAVLPWLTDHCKTAASPPLILPDPWLEMIYSSHRLMTWERAVQS